MEKEKLKKFAGTYMNIVGPIGNFMFYFQAFEIFSTQKSGAVSFTGFVISVIALTSWLLYGYILSNRPLIIANAVGLIGAICVVLGIILFPSP
ncbi:MAG: hypothetical protein IT497_06465 [Ottowia sp.]|nr:hypothetical protein [Ottowia sp.]